MLDKSKFPLLDNDLPDVSFDRLDYFVRDGLAVGFLPRQTVDMFLNNIFEKDDILYFKDKSIASLYAVMFMGLSRLLWMDPTSHGAYFLLSGAIKEALMAGEIAESDFLLMIKCFI